MIRSRLAPSMLLIGIVFMGGCDVFGGDDSNDPGAPLSTCLYNYGAKGTEEDFGKACTSGTDCAHGVCMAPGDKGNISNNVFSFCTRGCDCDNSSDASVSGSDGNWSCAYPGNCFVGQSKGAWRHVVPKCATLDDCLAIDSRFTHCESTSFQNVTESDCGQLHKVCQARQ